LFKILIIYIYRNTILARARVRIRTAVIRSPRIGAMDSTMEPSTASTISARTRSPMHSSASRAFPVFCQDPPASTVTSVSRAFHLNISHYISITSLPFVYTLLYETKLNICLLCMIYKSIGTRVLKNKLHIWFAFCQTCFAYKVT